MAARLLRFLERRGLVPSLSETERQALEAGTVWADGELFSGRPDFRRLLVDEPWPQLSAPECAFLEGPVEEVCRQLDPWRLQRERELPPAIWELLKRHRFFGLAIPERFGGHGFSALGCSTIFGKLASCSLPLSAVVLIPNSVGPAELLLHYGTAEQQAHYLPRLARGDEIPCFALTEPHAGSDAASLRARGTVFRAGDGRLCLRLDWRKRYITLAPVATLLGLAFRLHDPQNLLGKGVAPGITCALVRTDLPGVEVGERHDPLGVPFPNGPTSGRDVVVPVDAIIGGPAYAGQGWRMLMEALSAGRAISLPAQSVGGAKSAARLAGGYARVRRQFGMPVGRFAGVEEPLARIGAITYLIDAARVATCGAIDRGERPAVIAGVMKQSTTELVRALVNDAMDVLGGAGICRGPRNRLADGYAGLPIGITVEGANILTRTLITFGQGVMRCHPYARRELEALRAGDGGAFARALAAHLVFFARNVARTALLDVTRGRLARSPIDGPAAGYVRRLSWAAARFAVLTDLALWAHGARLKAQGKVTGRLADALAWMFLATAALRRFEAEGRQAADLPLLRWGVEHALARVQEAMEGVLANWPPGVAGALLRGPLRLAMRLNRLASPPSDALGSEVAQALQTPGEARDRLTAHVHVAAGGTAAAVEEALTLAVAAGPIEERLRRELRARRIVADDPLAAAAEHGLLDDVELARLREAAAAAERAIEVDSFSPAEYFAAAGPATASAS